MKFRQQNSTVGLDVGQTCARLIMLKRSGKQFIIERAEELNIEAEGILDENELYSASGLGKWLKDKKLDNTAICLGLPQYLCTTRNVNDFMANAKQEQLEQMVQFETTQLAGLSEETFLSDYQRMTPAYGVEAPVILGFSREAGSEEMATKCSQVPIKMADLAMGGFALANAFCYLHPEELQNDTPQIIIDIGTENSTIVIMAHGNVIYTGSMMFGGKRFTQVLAHIKECTEAEAERLKPTYIPDWEDDESPFLFAARQLETELRTSIENWRSGELEVLANSQIGKIWLSGGGSLTNGLPQHLAKLYGCPVELFGPQIKLAHSENNAEGNSPVTGDTVPETGAIPVNDVPKINETPVEEPAEPAKDVTAEIPATEPKDEVPEGLAHAFSAIKLKVRVPTDIADGSDTASPLQDITEGTANGADDAPVEATVPKIRKLKVTLPVPEEQAPETTQSGQVPQEQSKVPEQQEKQDKKAKKAKADKKSKSSDGDLVMAPAFTLAFGLALQTSGNAAYPISLAPRLRRWQIMREERLKFLILATFFFFATVALSMVYADYWITTNLEELNEGMDALRECDSYVPKLNDAMGKIEHQQRLLLPFVELGGRSKTFMSALSVINESKGPGDWCFYFADQYSYAEANVVKDEKEETREKKPTMATGDMFGGPPPSLDEEKEQDIKDEHKVVLNTMPLLTNLVVAGFTPVVNSKRFAGLVQLQSKLRASKLFSENVDSINQSWQGNGLNLYTGWNQYLKSQRQKFGEFTEFTLNLPLAEKQVNIPAEKQDTTKSSKNNKTKKK